MAFIVKGSFFDSAKVKKSLDAGTRKALSKCGAYVRTKSKSSLRYRKKASGPGQPPSVHRDGSFTRENKKTGVRRAVSPLKELIFFAWDARTRSVAVGPVAFARKSGTPRVLEQGGAVRITKLDPLPATSRKASKQQAASYRRLIQEGRILPPVRNRRVTAAVIAARPFMRPQMLRIEGYAEDEIGDGLKRTLTK